MLYSKNSVILGFNQKKIIINSFFVYNYLVFITGGHSMKKLLKTTLTSVLLMASTFAGA